MTRTKRPTLTFAGKPRNQEAARKRLVRDIRSARCDAERTIRKADRLLAVFDRSIEDLFANKCATRDALYDAVNGLGLSRRAGELLGLSKASNENIDAFEYRILGHLFGWSAPCSIAPTSMPDRGTDASATVSAQPQSLLANVDILAAANAIVAEAHDANIKIDWTDNPSTDYERELRLAIIKRFEAEGAKLGVNPYIIMPDQPEVAYFTYLKLNRLAPKDAEEIGEDLYDALERWREALKKENAANKDAEQRRLIAEARRDLTGQS